MSLKVHQQWFLILLLLLSSLYNLSASRPMKMFKANQCTGIFLLQI